MVLNEESLMDVERQSEIVKDLKILQLTVRVT